MSRSNRRRRGSRPWQNQSGHGAGRGAGNRGSDAFDDERNEFSHLLDGARRTEARRGTPWTVQPISASRAQKVYSCPGCGRAIESGVAHVAVWRADFVLGDDHALEARRHWHTHCWRVA